MPTTSEEVDYVEANGLRFAYIAEGEGPLVLLLHGFPDTARTWDDLRPRIAAKGYRAVSPFMRGYHPTAAPDRDAEGDTLARDALALIDALGAKEAILIGHDWGAATAYRATALAPEKVRKQITVALPHPGTLKPTLPQLWGVRHFFLYKLPGAASRFAQDDFAALPRIVRRWSPTWRVLPEDLADVRRSFSHRPSLDAAFGYYRELSFGPQETLKVKVNVPTVVFSGNDDPIARRSDYERAARVFLGEHVLEDVPGGHFLHREQPEMFAQKLLQHL